MPFDNRFPEPGVDARFTGAGVDVRFSEIGVDGRFLDGVDTRFEGETYGSVIPLNALLYNGEPVTYDGEYVTYEAE